MAIMHTSRLVYYCILPVTFIHLVDECYWLLTLLGHPVAYQLIFVTTEPIGIGPGLSYMTLFLFTQHGPDWTI